jgi:catechol 2,3-dioxygenase-like lactoylglutathione lyase family enzyme
MSDRQISHVTVNVKDRDRSRRFYVATLRQVGLIESEDPRGRIEYGRGGRSEFGFYIDPHEFFQKAHVAFTAASRDEVDRFYDAALRNGGSSLDAPRVREEFGLYSAYVTDPEGNAVEVACPLEGSDRGDER